MKQSPHCEGHSRRPDPTKETSPILADDSRESCMNKPKARVGRVSLTERYLNINKQQDGGREFLPQALPNPVPLFCSLNATSQDLLQPICPVGCHSSRSFIPLFPLKRSVPGSVDTPSSEYPCLESWDLNRNRNQFPTVNWAGTALSSTLNDAQGPKTEDTSSKSLPSGTPQH